LKRELHIFAIEPPVRKHGCCAFMMKSSMPSFKKRTAIRGKRNVSKHLSMAQGKLCPRLIEREVSRNVRSD
jgi:hypothetical protein